MACPKTFAHKSELFVTLTKTKIIVIDKQKTTCTFIYDYVAWKEH